MPRRRLADHCASGTSQLLTRSRSRSHHRRRRPTAAVATSAPAAAATTGRRRLRTPPSPPAARPLDTLRCEWLGFPPLMTRIAPVGCCLSPQTRSSGLAGPLSLRRSRPLAGPIWMTRVCPDIKLRPGHYCSAAADRWRRSARTPSHKHDEIGAISHKNYNSP